MFVQWKAWWNPKSVRSKIFSNARKLKIFSLTAYDWYNGEIWVQLSAKAKISCKWFGKKNTGMPEVYVRVDKKRFHPVEKDSSR